MENSTESQTYFDQAKEYAEGLNGHKKNFSTARTYLFFASSFGNLEAMRYLSVFLSEKGMKPVLNEREARELNDYGCELLSNNPSEEDKKSAYIFFEKSYSYNSSRKAASSLLYCLLEGIGTEKDFLKAAEYYYFLDCPKQIIALAHSGLSREGMKYKIPDTEEWKEALKKQEMLMKERAEAQEKQRKERDKKRKKEERRGTILTLIFSFVIIAFIVFVVFLIYKYWRYIISFFFWLFLIVCCVVGMVLWIKELLKRKPWQ